MNVRETWTKILYFSHMKRWWYGYGEDEMNESAYKCNAQYKITKRNIEGERRSAEAKEKGQL